jgi:hypothetical protein
MGFGFMIGYIAHLELRVTIALLLIHTHNKSLQLAIAPTSRLTTDPNSALCFHAYVVASWLQSLHPCSFQTALINRWVTVLLCPWPPSQAPGPPACRPTAAEFQTLNSAELSIGSGPPDIASGGTPQKTVCWCM